MAIWIILYIIGMAGYIVACGYFNTDEYIGLFMLWPFVLITAILIWLAEELYNFGYYIGRRRK